MRPEDKEYLALREERVRFGSRTIIVRELASASDLPQLRDDPDATYRLLVRSIYEEDGSPTFTDEDIPVLRASSLKLVANLIQVANRVNGLDAEDEAKKSGAAPDGG